MDVFSRDELLAAINAGERPKFLFFWGHRPKPGRRSLGSECLSQWWPSSFTVGDVRYPSAEHYMMAEKARLFGDSGALSRILTAGSPGAAKAIGREVRGFEDGVWEGARFEIVRRGSRFKFEQNAELRTYLLSTRGRVLVEASPRDRVWGIGLAAQSPDAERPERWRGRNLLGFALMAARLDLQSS